MVEITKDVAIIGAGPGGYVAAIRLSQLGKSVLLIEREEVGGLCLQHGCIPSKVLIQAADLYDSIKEFDKFGINIEKYSFDIGRLQVYKKSTIAKLTQGIKFLLKNYKIDVLYGNASFLSSNKLKISSDEAKTVKFTYCIIATGTKSLELPNLKFNDRVIGSSEALDLEEVPKDFIIIGGGYIGVELATAFAKLGSNVTIIELLDSILFQLDDDIKAVLQKRLDQLRIKVLTKSKVINVEENGSRSIAIIEKEGDKIKIESDKILVSVGVKPVTKELCLENTKVKLNDKGFIKINDRYQTDDKNIYAIGDITKPPFLAHKSSREGKIVAEIISNVNSNVYKTMPSVVFSDPEIAWIGLTEKEAREKNLEYSVKKFPFAAISKAVISSETSGFVKILHDKKTKKILGISIIGKEASNLIGEAALALEQNLSIEDIANTIHPHPTLTESIMEAAEYSDGKPIHIFDRKLFL